MKIVLVNTSDQLGGASRAAFRLHQGLCSLDASVLMLVQTKSGDHPLVLGSRESSGKGRVISGARLLLDKLPITIHRIAKKSNFSIQWLPDKINASIKQNSPDIINLHWVNAGFIQIESLAKFNKPIVWTMHDMWPFTGGCHYSQGCDRYEQTCGSCPQLHSQRPRDLSSWVLFRKTKAWRNLNLTLVSPSSWLADCAKKSSLFSGCRVEVIPNGIDTTVYKPINKDFAREVLGLPKDKRLILFGALSATSDERKGFHLLQPALKTIKESGKANDIELVIFGASQAQQSLDLPYRVHYLGTLRDDISLALVYSSADVFVLPSLQDNLPNTVLEALACGLPSVAFKIGGMPDMIRHQSNGFLAEPYSYQDLAEGLSWVLENQERRMLMSKVARKGIEENFTVQHQAHSYLQLFQEVLNSSVKRNESSPRFL